MGLTVQQLLAPLTATQIRSTMVVGLQTLGLQPQFWATGGIASSFLTVASNVLAGLSTQLSNAIAQQWNPTATGGGLELLSQYFYGLTPPQPTFATGSVQLTNTGGGVYTYGIGQATFGSSVANADGIYPQYTNTAGFTLNASATLSVPVQCTTIGTAGNAAPGQVSLLVTSMLGVACTNPLAILGTDGLTDQALRDLNLNSLAVRGSNDGPRGAYAYAIAVAVNSVTGLPVNVNRQSISISSHTGEVTIYVASPEGGVIATDLEGISNSIEALARPDCVTVLPGLPGYPSAPASAVTVDYAPDIVYYVVAPPGTVASDVNTAVSNALSQWFAGPSNPIGGLNASDGSATTRGIFESGVIGIIGKAVADIPNCYLAACNFNGSGDLPLSDGQVAVWAPAQLVISLQYSS